MVMKRTVQTSISFVLFALMLFKVSSFHAYSHQDGTSNDIENCQVCEFAIENQGADFLLIAPSIVDAPKLFLTTTVQPTSYDLVVTSSFLRFNFFGRPPPNLS